MNRRSSCFRRELYKCVYEQNEIQEVQDESMASGTGMRRKRSRMTADDATELGGRESGNGKRSTQRRHAEREWREPRLMRTSAGTISTDPLSLKRACMTRKPHESQIEEKTPTCARSHLCQTYCRKPKMGMLSIRVSGGRGQGGGSVHASRSSLKAFQGQ